MYALTHVHMFTCLPKHICSHGYMPSYVPNLSFKPKGGVGGIHVVMFIHPHILTLTCTRTHMCTCHLSTYVQYICSHVHVYISTYVSTCSLVVWARVHSITVHLLLWPVFTRSYCHTNTYTQICVFTGHTNTCASDHCTPVSISSVHPFCMYTCSHVSRCTYSHVHVPICTYVGMYICSYTHMLTCT